MQEWHLHTQGFAGGGGREGAEKAGGDGRATVSILKLSAWGGSVTDVDVEVSTAVDESSGMILKECICVDRYNV